MNVIRSACSNVILIYRDVRTCTELCVIKSVYIADSTVCTSCTAGKFSTAVGATSVATCSNCDAGKYSATAGVESVCVVCVFVSFQKKKRDTYTLYHTQFIHNTYKWHKHKSVSTNNRLVSYTHSLYIYR